MKCIYCGEDLKEGSLFCSRCGKEVQMVPDYNLFDDDYLKQVLAEENAGPNHSKPAESNSPKGRKNPEEQKKKQGSLKDRIMAGIERHNAYIRAKKALQGESNNG